MFIQSFQTQLSNPANLQVKRTFLVIILVFLVLYIGLRPLSFAFGDMGMYGIEFQKYKEGAELNEEKDKLFEMFLQWSSQIMTAGTFFFLCTALYIIPLFIVAQKWFKSYAFYAFLMMAVSFSFWAYGTNGIRNGIATSIFLLGISRSNKIFVAIWLLIAISVHKSLLLPTVAYLIVLAHNRPQLYLYGWLAAIPLSLILGNASESLFLNIGFGEEDRLAGYLGEETLDLYEEIQVGFRWDFLMYSATGAFAGWFFIIRKKYEDELYSRIYSTYLITNAIWIMVIRPIKCRSEYRNGFHPVISNLTSSRYVNIK